MRYEVILLDADGTLLDFSKAEEHAFSAAMARAGLPRTKGDFALYHAVNEGLWEALERGEITKERLKTERFARTLSRLSLHADCAALSRAYLEALGESHVLLPGALELCRTLQTQGRALYIATNGIGEVQHRRFAACGLGAYISGLFISEELGYEKPAAGFFDAVFARIGPEKRVQAAILGDSLSSDMQGGKNAGIFTCWFNPTGAPCVKPALCDAQIASLDEFPRILGL